MLEHWHTSVTTTDEGLFNCITKKSKAVQPEHTDSVVNIQTRQQYVVNGGYAPDNISWVITFINKMNGSQHQIQLNDKSFRDLNNIASTLLWSEPLSTNDEYVNHDG